MAFKSKSKSVKHGTSRFSFRSFFAAILRPFMAYPTDAPGVFASSDNQINVVLWNTLLLSNDISSRCELERVVYGKQTSGVEHEFLLLHFRHPTQRHAVAVLVLERTRRKDSTENNNGSSASVGQLSVVSPPSVSQTLAHDAVSLTPNIQSFLAQTHREHKYLGTLDFPDSARPSAIQLSVLLCVLSRHSPTYHLFQYQCYWYTHTVWEALKRLFPGWQETMQSAGRSRFCGQPITKANSVDEVCKQYHAEWEYIENMAEERRKAKEEEVRQLKMEGLVEGRAQRQPEIDQATRKADEAERNANEERRQKEEERRQKEEAERKADEERRQKEEERRQKEEARRQKEEAERRAGEYEAELNRMRARMAELERRAV